MNIDDNQEGDALKTGSAFSRDQRRKRDRPPRAVGGNYRIHIFVISLKTTINFFLGTHVKDTYSPFETDKRLVVHSFVDF